MTEQEFIDVVNDYGDACLQCGSWSEEDYEPYESLEDRAELMKQVLIAAYKLHGK